MKELKFSPGFIIFYVFSNIIYSFTIHDLCNSSKVNVTEYNHITNALSAINMIKFKGGGQFLARLYFSHITV